MYNSKKYKILNIKNNFIDSIKLVNCFLNKLSWFDKSKKIITFFNKIK